VADLHARDPPMNDNERLLDKIELPIEAVQKRGTSRRFRPSPLHATNDATMLRLR
jgi:hypothetical protein